jgi:hypothetical protein
LAHKVWHVAILASSLVALAGVAIVSLAPLVFESPPPGLVRARPVILALAALAVALLVVEWGVLHRRSL